MVQSYDRLGGEILLNTQTGGNQSGPHLAATAGGGFIATWTDASGVGGDPDFGIKAQRFDADGNPIAGEILVNGVTAGTQSDARVAVLPSGRFVVTWTDQSGLGGDPDIAAVKGRLFEADGTPVGGEFLVNTSVASIQNFAAITALSGGGFVIAWQDLSQQGGDASGFSVKAQLFSSNGVKVGGEFLVNTTTLGSQSAPSVTALPSDGFAVSWTDTSQTGGDTSLGAIRLQLFNSTGGKVGGEQLVNSVTSLAQTGSNLAALPGGGLVAVWVDASHVDDPTGTGIKGQLFDAAGAKIGGEFLINTDTDGDQRRPRASGLPDGGFIVTWETVAVSGSGIDVRAQIFDPAGNKVGTEFVVHSATLGNQSLQHVTTLASGDIAIAWGDAIGTGGDTSGTAVKAQLIGLGDVLPSDIALSNASVSETARENQAVATLTTVGALNSDFSYTIVSDSTGGAFAIADDKLIVQDNSLLDFEIDPTAEIRIRTTDHNGNSHEETLQVGIADTPEQGFAAGAEFLVNTTTQANQSEPEVVALDGGRFLVLYRDWIPNAGPSSGLARIFDEDGNPVTAELDIDATAAVALPGGGFAAIGAATGGDGDGTGLALRFFTASGAPIGGERPVNSTTAGDQHSPSLAQLPSGGFVAVWVDAVPPPVEGELLGWEIRGQLLDSSGDKVGGGFPVNSFTPGTQHSPEVTVLGGGGFVVTWHDEESGGIKAQMFGAGGQRLGSEFLVNPPTDFMVEPHVTALASGGFVVVWAENASSGGFAGIENVTAQIFDANGERVGDTILVGDPSMVQSIDVAALRWGGFVVSWAGYDDPATNNSGVRAQVFDGTGAAIGAELHVNGVTADNQFSTSVAELDSGAFVVSWTDASGQGGDASGLGVKAKIFAPLPGVELHGTAGDDTLTGTAAADRLFGLAGHDNLDGRAGADTMTGGAGNDTYVVGHAGDKVVEASATGGTDTVRSAIGYTLGANVENLVLTGAAVNGTGNGLANSLTGNAAANLLNGAAGADTMKGGAGNDTYIVDDAGDTAVETSAAGGVDTVRSAVGYTLGAHLENLVLTGTGATGGTGNHLANSLTGNAAANVLNGGGGNDRLDGGAGVDTMNGGDGNDVYFVDTAGDKAVEASDAGGLDTVNSTISFTLGANVENLVLAGGGGISGTGNGSANRITGNGGANLLDGKAGADTMTGGAGSDTYFVDSAGDKAIEDSAAGGTDLVHSSVSFALGAHLENLTLTGAAAVNASGNALANILTGNAAANVLNGGAGGDTMIGWAGDDFYHVDHAGDQVIEPRASGGTDIVQSSVSFALGDHVDNLTLTGTAADGTGNVLANILTGNAAANVLRGGVGADTVRGGGGDDELYGGKGGDSLRGGDGADKFVFHKPLGPTNVDHILDFVRGVDEIVLENAVFKGLAAGPLAAGAFVVGSAAADAGDRIIYDPATGALLYDPDGTGAAAAVRFAVLDTLPATLAASDFTVI